jgi:hypothetical protein
MGGPAHAGGGLRVLPSEEVFEHPLGALWMRVSYCPPAPTARIGESLSCVTQPSFQARVWRRHAAVGEARGLTRDSIGYLLTHYRPASRITAEQFLSLAARLDDEAAA